MNRPLERLVRSFHLYSCCPLNRFVSEVRA
jgi:hypothetical protein